MSCFDLSFSSDDAGQSIRVPSRERGEDDHLVGGAVRDAQLVAEPAKKSWKCFTLLELSPRWLPSSIVTFLRICQLFPPVSPVPGDLTEATVDPEPDGDGNDPNGIEEEDAGRHKYLKHVS